MRSSAFPAQLEITCSPHGCHLESGKPIYFPPQIGLVVLGRCRKPINHQRSLPVSLSQEACHLPGLDPHESRRREGRGAGRGARGPADTCRGARAGAQQMFTALRGGGQAGTSSSTPPAHASLRFDVRGLRIWEGRPGLQSGKGEGGVCVCVCM